MSIDPQQPPAYPPIARTLDYAPPIARARWRMLIGGVVISAVYAFSGGMVAYGLMLFLGNGRDAPEFVAVGIATAIFASGALVAIWLSRR